MSSLTFILSVLLFQLLFTSHPCHRILTSAAAAGRWQLLQKSIGISAMHMQLLSNDRVVVFDRTDFGPSNLPLPEGKCRFDLNDTALKQDCTAHSIEYDVLSNKFRPLMVQTDVWCSSGAVTPNGDLVQTGGFNDGEPGSGSAGWEFGRNPVLNPVLYRPDNKMGTRFETHTPTMTPRMYHSTAALLRDGRVLVGGSNPHTYYNFTSVLFPTELSLEAFCPPYLEAKFNNLRPTIVGPNSMSGISYGKTLKLEMEIRGKVEEKLVWITMVAPAFNTHSFSMNQRLLVLGNDKITALGKSRYNIEVRTPRSGNLAPAGFYLLFVVHQDIPSMGIWVKLQ
ncbi:galactose oxidase-like [Gossypium australe]|uniref:Galactose oxidase-like n=1 Tax=Gossypium australe TaxID=47621 RepID=A0A5B6WT06_9ROSI|nr:galactose oxidase-like [Gossypium australe]